MKWIQLRDKGQGIVHNVNVERIVDFYDITKVENGVMVIQSTEVIMQGHQNFYITVENTAEEIKALVEGSIVQK